ncbi:hypothetical protein J2TS6_51760 [Paenibacillus albilobatus]|uniref:Uncharacterized protein n=1 Tax=Paenibacillus albilobatus TaxID=2716884 RepID=A0A919XNH3_9BACL|nr:hypothetical protein [Paenibacillus albilobatus]GIO34035.1 hypothetical protein J2TS6_51760 [Paenibacillus albilobatus]
MRYSEDQSTVSETEWNIPFFGSAIQNETCRRREELLSRNDPRQKEPARLNEAEQAASAAERYAHLLELIDTVHQICGESVDWSRIAALEPPYGRGEKGPREQQAETRLREFKPTRLQKLLKQDAVIRQQLEDELERAKEEDCLEYSRWKSAADFARDILEGNRTAYLRVLEEFAPLNDLLALGSGLEFAVLDPTTVEVELDVNSGQIIPQESKRLAEDGTLVTVPLEVEDQNALEYKYACGCAFRIARELFALLPLETVLVHARDTKINRESGQEEYVTVLSIRFDRGTLSGLDGGTETCPPLLEHFHHHVKFDAAYGFLPVEQVDRI